VNRVAAVRAVEREIGRLIEVVPTEVGAPALLVRRQPRGPAFHTPRDQRNALERHAPSLGRRGRTDYSLFQTWARPVSGVRKEADRGKRFSRWMSAQRG
jgi:hypothetical protein